MPIIDKIQLSGTVYTIGSETTTAVTSASTDNEIPTAKAVYDAIPQGGGSGGKAIEAGRGISITSGETADTISFNLPISAGTGTNSLVAGDSTTADGNNSFAGGRDANASGNWSFAFGRGQTTNVYTFAANGKSKATGVFSAAFNSSEANNTYAFSCGIDSKANGYASFASGYDNKSLNDHESSFGQYNVSTTNSSAFGDSGNTLFSVGNGVSDNERHNAFEIRQNGDIYIPDTKDTPTAIFWWQKPMIKLQDALGGSTVDTEITSASTNPVTSAAIYNQFGGLKLVKLTQSEYDSLSTKNNSTLYVIVN